MVIVYCMVILGGLGNIAGVIAGAVLLSILPEFLREYGAYRMMSYGLILILLMALRPQGIMGGLGSLGKKKTRPDKENDRTRLASTLNAHIGPVFLTYPNRPSVTQAMEAADCREVRRLEVGLEL